MNVTESRQTQTDHATEKSAAIVGIACAAKKRFRLITIVTTASLHYFVKCKFYKSLKSEQMHVQKIIV